MRFMFGSLGLEHATYLSHTIGEDLEDPVEQFFDMSDDPWETSNLIDTPGLTVEINTHRKLLEDFEASMEPAPVRPG